jgi:hypothetical protein
MICKEWNIACLSTDRENWNDGKLGFIFLEFLLIIPILQYSFIPNN